MRSFWIVTIISTALSLLLGLGLWSELPDQVAVHFDLLGNPTEYSSKLKLLVWAPIINFASLVAVNLLLKFSLAKESAKLDLTKNIFLLNLAMSLLFIFLQAGLILPAYRPESFKFESFFAYGLSGFLGLLGMSLKDIPPNQVFGVRNRWSLASAENWKATHQFSYKVLGAVCFLSVVGFFLTQVLVVSLYFAILGFISIQYFSYRFSKLEKK